MFGLSYLFYPWGFLVQILAIVHFVRRRPENYWFFIILFGGFLGEMFMGAGDLVFGWRERGLHAPEDLKLSNPKARKMPYAPAIAIGTLISFFSH